MHRRSLLALVPAGLAALTGCGVAAKTTQPSDAATPGGGFTVTDVAGRTVRFDRQPERVVLGESRHVYSLLFLNREDPLANVVAWGSDLQRAAADVYAKLREAHPAAEQLPKIGSIYSNDLTVESLLAHRPDCVLFTLDAYGAGRKNGFIEKLDASGVTYVVTDFRVDPLKNTETSVRLIAEVMDRREAADEFLAFYHSQVDPVLKRAQGLADKPTTFLWRAPGLADACSTYARANLGLVITATGGTNIADGLLPGDEGVLTPEKVLSANPSTLIATGGHWAALRSDKQKTSHVQLGYLADEAQARDTLRGLRAQPGFEHLAAFDTGRVFAVYHQFYDSPYNFVAIQAFAKWQHPDANSELDPQGAWAQFHEKFMPWKASEVFVTSIS